MENVGICPKTGLRKGKWTPEEDRLLTAYVTRYGHWNWHELPKFAGVLRCGKSCRLRWMNYLKPSVKRGNFSKEEDEVIIRMHQELGNRWSKIAANLPGRTDNEIKNHWHTRLGKHMKSNTKHANQKRRKSLPDESTASDSSDMVSCDLSSSSADSEVVNSVQDDEDQSPVSSESVVDFSKELWDVPFRVEDFSQTFSDTSMSEETFYHCDFFDSYDMDLFFN